MWGLKGGDRVFVQGRITSSCPLRRLTSLQHTFTTTYDLKLTFFFVKNDSEGVSLIIPSILTFAVNCHIAYVL